MYGGISVISLMQYSNHYKKMFKSSQSNYFKVSYTSFGEITDVSNQTGQRAHRTETREAFAQHILMLG